MSRSTSKLTTAALVKKLDRVFSKYVRLKHADETGTVQCVTCGKLMHYKDSHAGHFVKRQHMSVRFDRHNVHPQCVRCNTYMGGRQDDYAVYLTKTYGMSMVEYLVNLKHEVKKFTRGELEELIKQYSDLVKTLESRLTLQD